jgi:hypothetical protein
VGEERARSLVRVMEEKDTTKQIEPFLCNQWYWWVIFTQLHEDFGLRNLWSTCFVAPPNWWSFAPTPYFFRSRGAGVGSVWQV